MARTAFTMGSPCSRMSCIRNTPSDITSPDGRRQVNVFGVGSPVPKAMVALNSQLAASGYRATPAVVPHDAAELCLLPGADGEVVARRVAAGGQAWCRRKAGRGVGPHLHLG